MAKTLSVGVVTRSFALRSEEDDSSLEFESSKRRKVSTPTRSVPTNPATSNNKSKHSSTKSIIFNYNVDPYDLSDRLLIDSAIEMFRTFDLLNIFQFDEKVLRKFLLRVKSYYNPNNLFHNFKHVWGVLHISFQILRLGGSDYLMPLDIFAVMIAALCHDIHHPGNNNAFELATQSTLSKIKNHVMDAGILERHHATITGALLNSPGQDYDIVQNLTEQQKEHFRRQVGLIILGTDMGKHHTLLAEACAYVSSAESKMVDTSKVKRQGGKSKESPQSNRNDTNSGNGIEICADESFQLETAGNSKVSSSPCSAPRIEVLQGLKVKKNHSVNPLSFYESQLYYPDAAPKEKGVINKDDPEWRICFTRLLVHTADIGAQTQSSIIAKKWMDRCYGEFRNQAAKERSLGIVTSPFLHDLKEEYKTLAAQSDFIDNTVKPLWEAMASLVPKLHFALDQLASNKMGYARALAELRQSGGD